MKKGGIEPSSLATQSVRFAGLLVPVILTVYGLFIQAGFIESRNFVSSSVFLVIALVWLLLAGVAFLFQRPTTAFLLPVLSAYFVLGATYSLFVGGFDNPLVVCWLPLIIAANLYFGKLGAQIGLVGFAIVIGIDALVLHAYDPTVQLADLAIMIAMFITTIAIVSIHRAQQVDQKTLDDAVRQESIEHERVLTLVNNLAEAILSVDKNGVVRVYNAASLSLLDTNGSLNGHHIDEIVKVQSAEGTPVKLFEELKNIQTVTVRDDLRYALGPDEIIRIEATLSPIRSSFSRSKQSDEYDGYIIILRDVTKAKSLEEERDEFISVVSHELRTPITITEGSISNAQFLLEREADKKILKDALAMAHDQTIFLARMINDLSTLSRAERGVADASEIINVKEMAEDLYKEYAPQAEEKDLHLNLDLGTKLGQVNVSRLYLHELLQNFITNAIKYTREGSITLSVKASATKVTFAVKDTGIGISKADRDKVFDKFYRAEDYRTRETNGTGLGLYVSAKLSKKLGCKIDLQSRLNHGSTFSFQLPLHKEPTKAAAK